jgi:surface polysaccharide O-acyltransferase-like enzyme
MIITTTQDDTIKNDKISLIWLDNSRIAAIFAVVFLHIAARVVMISSFGSASWWAGNV